MLRGKSSDRPHKPLLGVFDAPANLKGSRCGLRGFEANQLPGSISQCVANSSHLGPSLRVKVRLKDTS